MFERNCAFSGPKPQDYENFLKTGECRFKKLCERGIAQAGCDYLEEWYAYATEITGSIFEDDNNLCLKNVRRQLNRCTSEIKTSSQARKRA